ncbi:hypothetical protein Tco_0908597 [Tanacetum coccineum]|uniref:Uncharacterized protein n=1 Tax=Tanacetum coccineum TaxID=301880 RepID=A0ABQ5CQE2_9ASTR
MEKPPSYTDGEPMKIVITTKKPEDVDTEKAEEELARVSRVIPISIVIQITRPNPEIALIKLSSRPPLTDTTLEFSVSKPKTKIIVSSSGPMIYITPPKQPGSPPVAPKADRGKGVATDDTESQKKLLTEEQIKAHMDKEEMLKKAIEEAKLLAMSKPELIKVVHEEPSNVGIDPKVLASAKGGHEFKKIQDSELKVLNREHSQKVKRQMELRKKRLEHYMWTTSSRLKPKPITDVKIHPNIKLAVLTVYKGNDRRNFGVHNPFKFADFGVTELDELGPIIEKKKNKFFGELVISLGKIYERLKKISEEIGILSAFPAPTQAQSQSSGRKRKHMELEPEIIVPGLKCNRSLPQGVPFVNNMVIEKPEYEMFFIDVFGDEAFHRMNDMHKVDIETLRMIRNQYLEHEDNFDPEDKDSSGGTFAPTGQTQGGPSLAFVKENIDVLRTMIKDLDNKGQEKVTPCKLFNEESGGAGSKNSQMRPSAEEVEGYSSNRSSRSRSRGRPRSARKHRKCVSRKKGTSKSHRSVRSEERSRSNSKSVKSKPQEQDPKDHLSIFSAATEQEEWPMPAESAHIKGVPPVLRISAFMHGHGQPELAKKLYEKISKTVDEIWERVSAFIRGETAADTTEAIRSPRWEKSVGKVSWLENQNRSRNRSHRRGKEETWGPVLLMLEEKASHL